jgi:predicted transcriptional regulator
MAHTLTLPDDVYQRLEALAQQQGTTPTGLIESWVHEFESQEYIFHSEEEFMQMLGIDEGDMAWVMAEFKEPEAGEARDDNISGADASSR